MVEGEAGTCQHACSNPLPCYSLCRSSIKGLQGLPQPRLQHSEALAGYSGRGTPASMSSASDADAMPLSSASEQFGLAICRWARQRDQFPFLWAPFHLASLRQSFSTLHSLHRAQRGRKRRCQWAAGSRAPFGGSPTSVAALAAAMGRAPAARKDEGPSQPVSGAQRRAPRRTTGAVASRSFQEHRERASAAPLPLPPLAAATARPLNLLAPVLPPPAGVRGERQGVVQGHL